MDHPNIQNWFERLSPFHVLLILTLLGLLAYNNAINHPFVHDDVVFLVQNPDLENLNPKSYFGRTSSPEIDLPYVNQYYRPLLELTNRLLYRIVQLNPHGFHFFNILLHIINGFFVYQCFRLITNGKKGIALAIAAFFLVHPVQNEAVACISGISNLVFAFLCLLSFYCYLISTQKDSGRMPYIFSLVLFILALFAKEQSVILPFIILLYEICFSKDPLKLPRSKWRPLMGFLLVLAGYFLLRKVLIGSALSIPFDIMKDYKLVLLAIPRSILMYLSIIIFPHNLHYYRSQDILLPVFWPVLILTLTIVTLFVLVIRIPQPQKRWMIFGLGWFGISILPTLNLIPMINEYSLIMTAEHFVYFPIIGMLLFVFGLGHFWAEQKEVIQRRFMCLLLLVIISMVFIGMTFKQNSYWRGEIPLFERTLQHEKGFGRVQFLLAQAYANEGRYEDALAADHKALAIMQNYLAKIRNKEVEGVYTGFIKQIHYHLGYCLDILGDYAGSLEYYKKALQHDPDNIYLKYSVGFTYVKINDFQKAISYFQEILEAEDDNLVVMNSLAICYQEIGEFEKAGKLLRTIAEKDSQSVSAQKNLELFLKKQQ